MIHANNITPRLDHAKPLAAGFILPTTVILSMIVIAVAAVLLQYTQSTATTLKEDYYDELATQAAETGAHMASKCYESTIKSVDAWADDATLTPNKTCDLGVKTGASPYIMEQGGSIGSVLRTSYTVAKPAVEGDTVIFTSVGKLEFYSSSTSTTPFLTQTATAHAKDMYSAGTILTVPQEGQATMIATGTSASEFTPSSITSAITSDGAIYRWGCTPYFYGSCPYTPVKLDPTGSSIADKTLKQVSVGYAHGVILANDGTVHAWGGELLYGAVAILGNASLTYSDSPIAVTTSGTPMSGKTITQVSAGRDHTLALDSEGKVYAWGAVRTNLSPLPQLGIGTYYGSKPLPSAVVTTGTLNGKHITQISAGTEHSLALDSEGKVYAWGDQQSRGVLGTGTSSGKFYTPLAVNTTGTPMDGKTIVQISAGALHSLALDSEGKVYAWGAGSSGRLGNNSTSNALKPVAVTTAGTPMEGKTIVQVAAGSSHSLALDSEGNVYAWGTGALGIGSAYPYGGVNTRIPNLVAATGTPMENKIIVQISAGDSSFAIDNQGNAYGWGGSIIGHIGGWYQNNQPALLDLPALAPTSLTPVEDPSAPPVKQSSILY